MCMTKAHTKHHTSIKFIFVLPLNGIPYTKDRTKYCIFSLNIFFLTHHKKSQWDTHSTEKTIYISNNALKSDNVKAQMSNSKARTTLKSFTSSKFRLRMLHSYANYSLMILLKIFDITSCSRRLQLR